VIRLSQCCCTLAAFASLASATAAFAQQRPLVTEDPEVIGPGRLLIEGGFDWQNDVSFPLSGLTGNRWSVPTLGVSVGLSSIAELQIDGGLYQRLDISERRDTAPLADLLDIDGDRTSDIEDLVLATKVRLLGETPGRPAVALRFATKLPNASNENGLGTDMTDFFASLLVAKTVQSIRVVGNGGLAIIGDPTSDAPQQHDLLTFGFSVARAMTMSTEIVGEINGRVNFADGEHPPGGENRAVMRLGGRYTRATVRIDGGVLLGMTSLDPQFGFTAGFTWVFDAFRIP
jgi:hypothetical protein